MSSIPHGTANGYAYYECRCDLCRKANNEHQRELQRKPIDPNLHGTRLNYRRGCRCALCAKKGEEEKEYLRKWRRRRKTGDRWREGHRDDDARTGHRVAEQKRRRARAEEAADQYMPKILAAMAEGARLSQAAVAAGTTPDQVRALIKWHGRYAREFNQVARTAAPRETPHGTASGARYWKCECIDCRLANRGRRQ